MYRHILSLTALAALFAATFGDSKRPSRPVPPCHPTMPPNPTRCTIDNICFALDQSDSISTRDYRVAQSFASGFAESASERSATKPLLSAVAFSTSAEVIQTRTDDLSSFQNSVLSERRFDDEKSIAAGLQKCNEQLRCAKGSKTIVLVSDGHANLSEEDEARDYVEELRDDGVRVVTAAVGCEPNVELLRELAGSSSMFIDLDSGSSCGKKKIILEKICRPGGCDCDHGCGGDTSCTAAFDECEFTFAGYDKLATFDVTGSADRSFTPRIVAKDGSVEVGVLNMNDVVPQFIGEDGSARDITAFGSQPFTPTHFKPFAIEGTRGSGVGHQTFHGDQRQVARGKCVRVRFSQMQLWHGDSATNVNELPRSKCVVFRTE